MQSRKVVQLALFNTPLHETKTNFFDKFWQLTHIRNLVLSVIAGFILIKVNKSYGDSKFIEEFIIVFIAAFAVSAYFEFFLRKGISEENMRMYEMKEELGKLGVLKYYPNFKDLDLRAFFRDDIKYIEIYVHFAETVFSQVSDEIYQYCQKEGNHLNIFMLSPDNKFIAGLGELWGHKDIKYNEMGIKGKISSSQSTLTGVFEQLEKEGKLKANVNVSLLKRNPVFYSFYRFDNVMVYVPSKIVTERIIVPPAFLITNTHNETGLYTKCIKELELIKNEAGSLDIYFKNF